MVTTKGRGNGFPEPKPASKKVKNKKNPLLIALKVFFTLVLAALCLVIMAGTAAAGLLGGSVYGFIKTTPELDPNILKPTSLNSFVYDSENNVIAELKREENRVWIDYKDIPQLLIKAYVAVEDKRFFEHNGVDFRRVGSAILSYAKHFINKNEDVEGGSTITQQLIKNLTKNDDVTIKRKFQEQWQAMELEKVLTKEEILTYYLNNAPMGGNFLGIETAAKGYYGKDVRDLSLAECASLAGITNWPTKYMPTTEDNIEANLTRTRMILGMMLEQGKITQSEYDEAVAEDIHFQYNPEAGKVMKTSNQSYFVDEAIRAVKNELMERFEWNEQAALDLIYNGGLHIKTTLQPRVQAVLDEVYNNPEYFKEENPKTDEMPESAMVILDPNGNVCALYGGRGAKEGSVFNRATQAVRSPGSSIKPLVVYAPGIDSKHMTPATVVDDVPQYLNTDTPDKIWPKNVEGEMKNFGLTTVRDGLLHSRNVVATLLLRDYTTIPTGLDYLAKVGLDRKNEQYLSITMGGFTLGMTPLQMASGYTVFANKGVYTEPVFFTEVLDQNGKVLISMTPERHQVYSEQTIFLMDNMMEDIVKRGTAAPYGIVKYKTKVTDDKGKEKEKEIVIPSAGKTGTSDDNKDKWFCGFTPYYVGVTWYGYDKAVSLTKAEYSSALKIWNAVMTKVHETLALQPQPFFEKMPPNIVKRNICIDSGKIATDLCAQDYRGSRVRQEYFIEGTEPAYSDVCTLHVQATVCTESRDAYGRPLLATEYCPATSVGQRVFFRRPVEYKPKFPDDPYPVDIINELPEGEYCTVHGPQSGTAQPAVPAPSVQPTEPIPDPVQPGGPPVEEENWDDIDWEDSGD